MTVCWVNSYLSYISMWLPPATHSQASYTRTSSYTLGWGEVPNHHGSSCQMGKSSHVPWGRRKSRAIRP